MSKHSESPVFLSPTDEPGSLSAADQAVGSTVDERFLLLSAIGAGANGRVYLAENTGTGQKVALKILNQVATSESGLIRFRNEVRVLSALDHPNITKIYAAGLTEDQRPYFAQEFLEGASLDKLCEKGRVPAADAIALCLQLCDAIEYIHARSVVHRDIKPANIFQDVHGKIKLLDFGIVKLLEDQNQKLTKTGSVVGSPAYMSPEQLAGGSSDKGGDIYSAGCVLYELLTGRHAFSADSLYEMIIEKQTGAPRLISGGGGDPMVGRLNMVLARVLAADPTKRYQDIVELKEDLALIVAGEKPVHAGKVVLVKTGPQLKAPSAKKLLLPLFVGGIAISAAVLLCLAFVKPKTASQNADVQEIFRSLSNACALEASASQDLKAEQFERAAQSCLGAISIYESVRSSFARSHPGEDFRSYLLSNKNQPNADIIYEGMVSKNGQTPSGIDGRCAWVWATYGESALREGKWVQAANGYNNALRDLRKEGEQDMNRRQLQRLRETYSNLSGLYLDHVPDQDPGLVKADGLTLAGIEVAIRMDEPKRIAELKNQRIRIACKQGNFDRIPGLVDGMEQAYKAFGSSTEFIADREREVVAECEKLGAHKQAVAVRQRLQKLSKSTNQ
jgi:serine/threonine protein kinase